MNARIFKEIASTRQIPVLPVLKPNQFPLPSISAINGISYDTYNDDLTYEIDPPSFEVDNKRDVVTFKREFGPLASNDGIELRLNYGVRVLVSVEGGILVDNDGIRIAVSSDKLSSALQHPMGSVVQKRDRADIIAVDGLKNNTFV